MKNRFLFATVLGGMLILHAVMDTHAASSSLGKLLVKYLGAAPGSAEETEARDAILKKSPKTADIVKAFEKRKLEKHKPKQLPQVDVPETGKYFSIIIPKGYNGKKKFPMVVCLHGGGNPNGVGYEAWWWAHGRMTKHLVMAPTSGSSSWWAPAPKKIVLQEIRHALLNFAIDPDRIFLVGFSNGGAGVWAIGMRHPHHFAALGPCAGSLHSETQGSTPDLEIFENLTNTYVLIQHGSNDRVMNPRNSRRASEELGKISKMKGRFKYIEHEGVGHTHPMGREIEITSLKDGKKKRLQQAVDAANVTAFIKNKKRDPLPKEFIFITKGPNDLESYWVDVEAKEYPARVEGKVKGNDVTLTVKDVAAVTVYLHPDLVNMEKSVTITINGKEEFNGVPEESIETALETLKRDCDSSRVFPWKKRFEVSEGEKKESE
ncbi:MAG: carboxylesterase family protein [Planctomycetota bacterium]|jgi:hypothetical protein